MEEVKRSVFSRFGVTIACDTQVRKRKNGRQKPPVFLHLIFLCNVMRVEVEINRILQACLESFFTLVNVAWLNTACCEKLILHGLPYTALHRFFQILKVYCGFNHMWIVNA